MAGRNAERLILDTWNKDPTKMAVLRAIAACLVRLGRDSYFRMDIGEALPQQFVCLFYLYSLDVEE